MSKSFSEIHALPPVALLQKHPRNLIISRCLTSPRDFQRLSHSMATREKKVS
jgi:hypothetical protein